MSRHPCALVSRARVFNASRALAEGSHCCTAEQQQSTCNHRSNFASTFCCTIHFCSTRLEALLRRQRACALKAARQHKEAAASYGKKGAACSRWGSSGASTLRPWRSPPSSLSCTGWWFNARVGQGWCTKFTYLRPGESSLGQPSTSMLSAGASSWRDCVRP